MFDLLSGTFSDAAATNCTPCPPGYACPNSSDSTQKFPCPLGTYSVGSKTECTECPAAHRCPHKEYVFLFLFVFVSCCVYLVFFKLIPNNGWNLDVFPLWQRQHSSNTNIGSLCVVIIILVSYDSILLEVDRLISLP